MVATVTQLTSATSTSRYFEQEGYYAKDDPEHRKSSRWHGRGAAALPLGRHVSPTRFTAVLEGRVPGTDTVLGRIRDGEREHRPGVDITLQAPKSVSLAALVAGDNRIIGAHDAAVRATLDFVEEHLLVTRRWDRAARRHVRVNAPSMVAATFRHKANRNLEPHLHTHAVVANMTRREDGNWGSLDMGPLGPARRLIGAHYRNELAARLRKLGYALRPSMVGQVPGFEIEGYSRELIMESSTRRTEIMDWIESRGLANTTANRQKAAYATRKTKGEPHHLELEAKWRGQAREMGIDRNPPRPAAGRRRQAEEAERLPSMLEIVARSVEHLAERSSVFRESDLCMLSLAHSPGVYTRDQYVAARKQLKRDGHLVDAVRRGLGPCLVTTRALRAEREIVRMMKRARGKGQPIADPDRVRAALSDGQLTDGQKQAVETILLGDNVTVGVQGYAGTGKTAMLRTVKDLAGERRAIALAPSAAAVRGLRVEAGFAARTLQGFLARYRDVADGSADDEKLAELRDAFAGSVLVLDEASMTGTTQMRALMRIAERLDVGRLVLVGDKRQLRAVEAGQPFRQLQQAGMSTAVMDDVLRQRTQHLQETVAHMIAEKPAMAIESLGGQVHEVGYADLGRTAGELWLGLDEAVRAATIVLAPTHEIRAEINETVREGLAEEGILHGRELELDRLVTRGMTRSQKGDIRNWSEGDAAVFHHDLWGGKARAGDCFTVLAIEGEHAVLVHEDGRRLRVKPGGKMLRYQLELYETTPIRIRAGDHVRWTRNDPRRGLVNGAHARVLGIGPKEVRLAAADGREIRFARDDAQLRHIDHAYSSTVHGAQGITADRVIAVLDSAHGALTDQATFYVEVSRARDEVVVLTDNREQLAETLEERTGLRMTAMEAVGERFGGREAEADRIVLRDKEPLLLADRIFETLRENARAEGRSVLDMPGFRDASVRLEHESGLENLHGDYRKRLEGHRAMIGRETARRNAVASYRERSRPVIRWLYESDRPVEAGQPEWEAAEGLARDGQFMLDAPEYAPHLDGGSGLRDQVESDLVGLRSAMNFNEAMAVRRDWEALETRAKNDGTLPCYVEGHDELISRMEALAADPFVPDESATIFGRIIDECRLQRQRQRHVREFTERVVRSRSGRSALFRDAGPAVRHLPQQRRAYSVWRREADDLHGLGDRMSREGAAWEPHLAAVRSSLDTLRSWLVRLTEMFRRDDQVLSWAEEDVGHDPGGRAADARYSIRAAGDLVPGDRIRWTDDRDGTPKIREDLVVGLRPGRGDSGDVFEIQEGSGRYVPILVPRPIRARDLFRGNVHRQPWPDEDMREDMRPEAVGPFSIACGTEGGIAARVPDEGRIVPGDRIRWIEMVRGDSRDGTDGVRAVVADVISVEPGTEPASDRIRFRVLGSTGTEAFPEGTERETSLRLLSQAGRVHRAGWASEGDRGIRLGELEKLRAIEIDRSRGFGMSM
ncbi:MAG: relaxase domain-containing protein [Rhodobacteraceae bacterium]|nr:relaxase domain-containing protein [Paracoccaceae bacterium]MCY4137022.1 relaxase domain-containing protein [Paracoccaceae bacterium]